MTDMNGKAPCLALSINGLVVGAGYTVFGFFPALT